MNIPDTLKTKKASAAVIALAVVVAIIVIIAMAGGGDDTDDTAGAGQTDNPAEATTAVEGTGIERVAPPGDRRVHDLPIAPPPPQDAPPAAGGGIPRADVTLPANFPTPDGTVFLESNQDGRQHVALFSVNSTTEAVEFYRRELPAAKFYVSQVRQDPTRAASADFQFFERGNTVPMSLTIEGQTARLVWEEAASPPPPAEDPDE